jgi:amidophosphoribosyltransferase
MSFIEKGLLRTGISAGRLSCLDKARGKRMSGMWSLLIRRRKLNPMQMEFKDRNVLIVDDSIVRGTTSREIVQMARDSGARRVYFASCAPPIRYPNVYGIDMPTSKELVAFERTEDEIAKVIGADRVIFQNLEDLEQSVSQFNPALTSFDMSVFNGSYVTGDVTQTYLKRLESERNDEKKDGEKGADTDVIGLHNRLNDK